MKISSITPKFIDRIPKSLEDSILYISEKYSMSAHNCCCGCKSKIVLPLKEGRWTLTECNGRVSLYPSVGNWSLACQSHYWIEKNGVRWSTKFSQSEIRANRARDKKILQAEHAGRREKEPNLWERIRDEVKSWFVGR